MALEVKLCLMLDACVQVEKIFLIPSGIPSHNATKHAIFASPSHSVSQSTFTTFPGIYELVYQLERLDSNTRIEDPIRKNQMREGIADQLKRHVTDLLVVIHQATLHLQKFHLV